MSLAVLSSKIYTGIPDKLWVSALYAEKGRIVKIGSNAEIESFCSKGTKILKLPGKMVSPGCVDAHCHFVGSGLVLQSVQLNKLTSLEACLNQIKKSVEKTPKGEWIIGRGWNHLLWENPIEPDKSVLDIIAPDHPVAMTRVCGHSTWVNSKVLVKANIDEATPNPKGGTIDRSDKGETTGIIREALSIVTKIIPPPDKNQLIKAALDAQENAIKLGITCVRSMEDLETYQILQHLENNQLLKLRICQCLPPEDIDKADAVGIHPDNGSENLWHQHVKIFADGSLGANTALMFEPYTDCPEVSGLACLSVEEMQDAVEFAYLKKRSIAIHAIGDLALSNAISAIEGARKKYPGYGKDTIEHVQIFKSSDLARIKKLGISTSFQPIFLPTDWKMATNKWGPKRCKNAYAWKSIIDAEIPYLFGTDHPIEPNNPLLGIQAAMTRRDFLNEPECGWHLSQKLDLETCLNGYSFHAANVLGQPNNMGNLEPGKWADMTVWDQDLTSIPAKELQYCKAALTIINGEIVAQQD